MKDKNYGMANQQSNDEGMRELALFAGAGGGILGGKLLGWRTVCAVEWDAYAASVLVSRQNDVCLEAFPVWDDVQTFDGRPWKGLVDVVSGGFPCTDISCAGKGAGIDGDASSMWRHMARIIGEVRPRYAFVENSPMLTFRGLDRVLGDLSTLGYDARWGVVSAAHAGAPHRRERIWVVSKNTNTNGNGLEAKLSNKLLCKQTNNAQKSGYSSTICWEKLRLWKSESSPRTSFCGMVDGLDNRVDRLKSIGNGQVPCVAATAWKILGGE
jgi:DNA (cytosine-5)-methyltransferase 1